MLRVVVVSVALAGCGFSAPDGTAAPDGLRPDAMAPVDAADAELLDPDAPDAPVMPDWWDASYRYRAPIRVRADIGVDATYAVRLRVNTKMLVDMGKAQASGEDWRIVRRTATGWTELDRWVDDAPMHAFNTGMTDTWFRLPAAIASGAEDAETYVYFGGQTTSGTAPLADPNHVFLFADDFEDDFAQWTRNSRGESPTLDTVHAGGQKALKLVTNGTEGAGLHRDMPITGTVLFSHWVKQAQTGQSFGNARAFAVVHSARGAVPRWVDPTLRVPTELDSANKFQIWTTTLDNWSPAVNTDWRFSETVVNLATNTITVRMDGGAWHGPRAPENYQQGTPIASIALEGETSQSGTFYVDNYIIRPFVMTEPTTMMGEIEPLP